MALTQESLLSALIKEGGKIKNSELLSMFKTQLNCSDPTEKKQNRDLFKTCVNNVAVVKEIEDTKYVVLKKKYQHLLEPQSDLSDQKDDGGGIDLTEVAQHPAGEDTSRSAQSESATAAEMNKSEQTPPDTETNSADYPEPSFIELALQRHNSMSFKARKSMQFKVPLKPNTEEVQSQQLGTFSSGKAETGKHKPLALPLRIPVVITPPSEIKNEQIKTQSTDDNSTKVHLAPVGSMLGPQSSPRLRRRSHTDIAANPNTLHFRSAKPLDEPKYGETFPLDTTEHGWMVTSAAGRWGLVYGYLLKDAHLAEKRDFISGFTALHWAAKCGKSDILCKIIDMSRRDSKGVDINTKSFAGYTPLHIAAIHHQEYIIGILVKEYGANCHIRDNSGKKAHHYLHKGISEEVREMLGEPKVVRPELQKNTEDGDTQKHSHTISRLFQPQTVGYKKKPKSRNTFLSIAEDSREERDEHGSIMHRVRSDIFS
ncbi:ankyrin repeat domain-containing protein SOWAHA [Trichomycterus rosablanca]|uniref:ankyrin repeat domain-containing protein SOWAHA n=1 Tax=Trichomycterus rosablanca TaxID=2290929 RepID=UPI002F35BC40